MRIVMAPLRGVTTATYRRIYKAHFNGVTEAMAPFISTTKAANISNNHIKDILPINNENSYPVIPQIIGKEPLDLPPYINKFREIGCTEVNWNLGCPAPMVTKKMRGSGLLPHPERVDAYTKVLQDCEEMEYSVKVRAGLNNENEILELLPILERNGCKEITVHPRTASQGYTGRANPEVFQRIIDRTSLPLLYNGDIVSIESYNAIQSQFGDRLSGVMLGRGILINPFLPMQIQGESIPDNGKEIIRDLMTHLYEAYSEELNGIKPVLGRMKELWQYFPLSFPDGQRAIKKILKCTSADTYKRRVDQLFETDFIPPTEYTEQY